MKSPLFSIELRTSSLTRKKILILLIVPALLYFILLPMTPLMEPDEARYSDIPSLMNRSGDYVTPHLNYVVYLEKPPLCYWATALFFKIFGENEFSSRLFVAFCAWGCLMLVYKMGAFFHDERTGLYSAAILSTSLCFFIFGRMNILDIPLTFFVGLGTWAGYRYIAGNRCKRGWLYLLYFASGLAFLTKGLIGVVFPFVILLTWLSFCKRWRDILGLVSPVGMIIFLSITSPWVILAQKANKDFMWFFFLREHFLRFTSTIHGRKGIFLYYIPVILFGTLPWSALLLKFIRGEIKNRTPLFRKADGYFLTIWIIFIFVFFSLSSSKLIPYILPVFLPLAVIIGHLFRCDEDRNLHRPTDAPKNLLHHAPALFLSLFFILPLLLPPFLENKKLGKALMVLPINHWWKWILVPILFQLAVIFLPNRVERRWKSGRFMTVYIFSALYLAALIFPISQFLTPYKSAYPVAQAVKKLLPADQELFQFRTSLYGIDFYNKIRTPMVDATGELRLGIDKLSQDERSHYFPSSKEFFRLCKERGTIYCVTQHRENIVDLQKKVPNVEAIWENGVFYLLRLRDHDPLTTPAEKQGTSYENPGRFAPLK